MKILLTGGLGYLGSHLLKTLPARFPKAAFFVLDNLSTGNPGNLPEISRERIEVIKGDVLDYSFSSLSLGPDDFVLHLAALSDPAESFSKMKEYESVNLEGALRTADYCASSRASFFFPSTTSIYHQTAGKWIYGTRTHVRPQTPYAHYKWRTETKLRAIQGLRYSIVRFATLYGAAPGNTFRTAVNKFCWQAVMGQPLTIWETALGQWRPYLGLNDASKIIEAFLRRREFRGKTFHAASENATVRKVVDEIKRLKPETEIRLTKAPAMNRLSYKVSNRPLGFLNLTFRDSLKEGVRELMRELSDKIPGSRNLSQQVH